MLETTAASADVNTNPDLSLESGEISRVLLLSLEKLPEKTRSMLILHYFNGLKYDTIGKILDTNVNTVKVEVHRGRKKLKDILAKEFPERVGNL
jgi:RNA polymerase sigma-70 factor (ECF subfamily)